MLFEQLDRELPDCNPDWCGVGPGVACPETLIAGAIENVWVSFPGVSFPLRETTAYAGRLVVAILKPRASKM